jgi:hypothetical protein
MANAVLRMLSDQIGGVAIDLDDWLVVGELSPQRLASRMNADRSPPLS